MTIESIIRKTRNLKGNHYRENGDVYISSKNMDKFAMYVKSCDNIQTVLITPYLINLKDGALYELHYYEFELEVIDTPKSYFVEYTKGNVLPKEIIDNIKPKAVIAKYDKEFLLNALYDYLKNMKQMTFKQDRGSNKRLENAELFYQIF